MLDNRIPMAIRAYRTTLTINEKILREFFTNVVKNKASSQKRSQFVQPHLILGKKMPPPTLKLPTSISNYHPSFVKTAIKLQIL